MRDGVPTNLDRIKQVTMRPPHQRRKRQHQQKYLRAYGDEPEECVDDMAVPEAFVVEVPVLQPIAVVETPEVGAPTDNTESKEVHKVVMDDDDEEEDDSDSNDEESNDDNKTSNGDNKEKQRTMAGLPSHASDDSDSDFDFDHSEALSKMKDEDGNDGKSGGNRAAPSLAPKTENEVDLSTLSLHELESNLQMDLTVEEQEFMKITGGTDSSSATSLKLVMAGRIKCHLVKERIVVVESQESQRPLVEGRPIVVRYEDQDSEKEEGERLKQLLPLGKVFEVFGPVSRPLYSIRVVQPTIKSKPNKSKSKRKGTDHNRKKEECRKEDSRGKTNHDATLPTDEIDIDIDIDEGDNGEQD